MSAQRPAETASGEEPGNATTAGASEELAPGAPAPSVPASGAPSDDPVVVGHNWAGRAWVRILPGIILLALILVFVFQNLHSVKVSFFTASGKFPLALALFASAAAGALMVLAIGSVRILQLKRAVRRHSS